MMVVDMTNTLRSLSFIGINIGMDTEVNNTYILCVIMLLNFLKYTEDDKMTDIRIAIVMLVKKKLIRRVK